MNYEMDNEYSIAPEVIKDGVAKAPADVYSFGCVVNEIFSEKESYADYSFATVDDVHSIFNILYLVLSILIEWIETHNS